MNENKKTIVIITSVISFVEKKLSYAEKRSVFSPRERLEQTKKTIASIREKIPEAKIILCEQGISAESAAELATLVDYYEYIGNNFLVRKATDSSFKGLGEAIGLLHASTLIPKDAARIFKISGRYYLNENFDENLWHGDFVIKKYSDTMSTRLYYFNKNMLGAWKRALYLSVPFLLLNRSIEKTLLWFIPKRLIQTIDTLGVSGAIGVNNETITE